MQKTVDTLEDLESRLEGWITDIENKISEGNSKSDTMLPPVENVSIVFSKLNDTESLLMKKMSHVESALKSEAVKLKETATVQAGTTQILLTEVSNYISYVKKHVEIEYSADPGYWIKN